MEVYMKCYEKRTEEIYNWCGGWRSGEGFCTVEMKHH